MQFQRIAPGSVACGEGNITTHIRQLPRGVGSIGQGEVPIRGLFTDGAKSVGAKMSYGHNSEGVSKQVALSGFLNVS